jgi:predicted transcriptional regulator
MNRIEVGVLTPQAALRAFADTWQAAEAGEEQIPRLTFGSLKELFAAITEARLRLLREVAAGGSVTLDELAQRLSAGGGAERSDVEADVSGLIDLGLLQRTEDGGLATPYDEIVIHAELRDAA